MKDNTSVSIRSNSSNCTITLKKKTENTSKYHPPIAKIDLVTDDISLKQKVHYK